MFGSCHIRANEEFQKITIALFSQAPPFSLSQSSSDPLSPRQFLEAWGKAAAQNTSSTLSTACKGWEFIRICMFGKVESLQAAFLSTAVSRVFVWSGKFGVGKGKYCMSKNMLCMFYPIGKEHITFRFLLTLLKSNCLRSSYTRKQLCT